MTGSSSSGGVVMLYVYRVSVHPGSLLVSSILPTHGANIHTERGFTPDLQGLVTATSQLPGGTDLVFILV